MGLFEDVAKGPISTLLLGLGVAMVAPTVLPTLASGLRPLAKTLVKGGVTLYDVAKEGIAEAGEQLNDLVAESRAEMADESRSAHRESSEAGAGSTRPRRRQSRA